MNIKFLENLSWYIFTFINNYFTINLRVPTNKYLLNGQRFITPASYLHLQRGLMAARSGDMLYEFKQLIRCLAVSDSDCYFVLRFLDSFIADVVLSVVQV